MPHLSAVLWTTGLSVLLCGACMAAERVGAGDETEPVVSRPATAAELSELLQLQTYSGTFLVSDPCTTFAFVVEGHVGGLEVFSASAGSVTSAARIPAGRGSFRVQVVDLDIVKLNGSEPGHWRVIVQVFLEGVGGSTASKDVEKASFDLGALQFGAFDRGPSRRAPEERRAGLGRTEIFRRFPPASAIVDGALVETRTDSFLAAYFVAE